MSRRLPDLAVVRRRPDAPVLEPLTNVLERLSNVLGSLADVPVLDRLRAVRATEVVRAVYGLGELVAPDDLALQALGVRRTARERTVARLLGVRHVAQAVLTTLVGDQRARIVGGGVDALHSASMVAWALADRRRARQAWGEAVSAALFAGAELAPLLPPLVRAQQNRRAGAAAGRAGTLGGTTRAGSMGISGDAASPTHARLTAPDPERERRRRAAIRQQVIADVTERADGRGTARLMEDLQQALAQRGMAAEPRTWLHSVAADAAAGHLYVISEEAIRDAGLEMPHGDGGGQ
jgi:hypothetical protein